MPGKLIGVLVLVIVNVIASLATGSILSAILGGLLALFLFRGSHVARIIAIVLSVIGLCLTVYWTTKLAGVRARGIGLIAWALIALSYIQGLFTIWALLQRDVVEWMDSARGAGPARADNDPPRYV